MLCKRNVNRRPLSRFGLKAGALAEVIELPSIWPRPIQRTVASGAAPCLPRIFSAFGIADPEPSPFRRKPEGRQLLTARAGQATERDWKVDQPDARCACPPRCSPVSAWFCRRKVRTRAIDRQTDLTSADLRSPDLPSRQQSNAASCRRMRNYSDRHKRLQGALDAVDDALFGISPKDKFDVDRADLEAHASEFKALNQRIQQLDEYYSRAVAELKASLRE
jgi:hypothetical protein